MTGPAADWDTTAGHGPGMTAPDDPAWGICCHIPPQESGSGECD